MAGSREAVFVASQSDQPYTRLGRRVALQTGIIHEECRLDGRFFRRHNPISAARSQPPTAQIQYDMFFAGAIPKRPFEASPQFEQPSPRYATAPMRKYAHRFLQCACQPIQYPVRSSGRGPPVVIRGDRSAQGKSLRDAERVVTSAASTILSRSGIRSEPHERLEARRQAWRESGTVPFETFLQGHPPTRCGGCRRNPAAT
jgi:hypothetical protein